MTVPGLIAGIFAGLAGVGCVYTLASLLAVRAYARRGVERARATPAVTILKPLHGDEAGLFDNLASFCRQTYVGPVEIVFGVREADDPAVGIARAVMAAFPQVAARLVIDPRRYGQNGKISNLMNMEPAIVHEVVVLADSDMVVAPNYLDAVIGALEGRNVGLVTCLYRGLPTGGLWSRLAVQGIDFHFLPNVLFGLSVGLAKPCFGSTIALRRETLARIGGFAAFKDVLADDNAMGQAVRGLGLAVAVPARPIPGHVCAPAGFMAMFRQDLRWSRTIMAVDWAGFVGSIVTNPLPLAIIAWLVAGFGRETGLLVMATLACRLALQLQVRQFIGARTAALWLGPLRDIVSFAVFGVSFWPGSLDWRGHKFAVRADGTMTSHDQTGS